MLWTHSHAFEREENMVSLSGSSATQDEVALLVRMQAGDEDAFETCVRLYCGQLLAVAQRILHNEEDARDAVQDAFLSAFKKINRFESRSLLSTWLHRIVLNAALYQLRTRQRRPQQRLEDVVSAGRDERQRMDLRDGRQESSERILEQKETCELVHRTMSQLPENHRIILLLRDIEQMDTEQTARKLGTNPGVVKTRLHRARQAFRSLLRPCFRTAEE